MAPPPVGPAWYRVLLTVLCVIGVVWFAVGRAWVPALICALGTVLGVIDVVRPRRSARGEEAGAQPFGGRDQRGHGRE